MMEPTDTILLAEEDPDARSYLAENLIADGYHVLEADTRAKALGLLAARAPQLLIADATGETLSLVDAVRDADGLASRIDPGTPLLALSARADQLARVRYLERGCISSAAATTCSLSPTATRSCAPACERFYVARRLLTAAECSVSVSSRSTSAPARCSSTRAAWS
jgi:CheY-like chemotaxis protein